MSTPDTKVLDLGAYMCNASSYGEAVSALVGTDNGQSASVTTEQADFFVRSAIINLCPQQKAMLP